MQIDKKFILIVGLVLIVIYGILVFSYSEKSTKSLSIISKRHDFSNLYRFNISYKVFNDYVDSVKYYEGLKLIPYEFNHHWYVGYGHLMSKLDFIFYGVIDSNTAIKILISDINKHMNEAFRLTHLRGNKLLCVTDLVYNYGSKICYRLNLCRNPHLTVIDLKRSEVLDYCFIFGKWNLNLFKRRNMDWRLWQLKN